jgi:hypothetical protein
MAPRPPPASFCASAAVVARSQLRLTCGTPRLLVAGPSSCLPHLSTLPKGAGCHPAAPPPGPPHSSWLPVRRNRPGLQLAPQPHAAGAGGALAGESHASVAPMVQPAA